MTKCVTRFGACLSVLLLGAGTAVQAAECPRDGTLIVGAGDYRPHHIVEGNTVTGMDFEVLEAVLGKLGCSLDVQVLPWARHLKGLEEGTVDVASPVTKTPEREEFAAFSSVYVHAVERLFVRPGQEDSFPDLKSFFENGEKLGVIREFAYGGGYDDLKTTHAAQIEEVGEMSSNIKKVAAGRLTATIGDEFVTASDIKAAGMTGQVVPASTAISSYQLYFMFSKKSVPAEFVTAFNAELEKMQGNGEFDAITAKYK